MGEEIIVLVILKLKKFYGYKRPIFLDDVNTDNLLVSNRIPYGGRNCKYFFGYLHGANKIKPLHRMLPKARA